MKNMKMFIFYLFAITALMIFPKNVFADTEVFSEVDLINSLNEQVNGDVVINLGTDITISEEKNITGNVTINGNGYKLIYTETYTGTIFNVSETGNLILSNVIVDGKNEWNWVNQADKLDPYKYVTSDGVINLSGNTLTDNAINVKGSLTLNNGSKIQNFVITATEDDYNNQKYNKVFIIDASGTENERATIVFDGIVASNNIGVILHTNYADVEVKGNTQVIDNYGFGRNGGIFNLSNNTNATLTSTIIKDNVSDARSGTIFGLSNNSLLIMNDGTITNNLAKYWGNTSPGAMIVVESGSGFKMNGGSITNNIGTISSVVASRWTNGYNEFGDKGIEFNGGTVSGNTCYKDSWHNATIFARSKVTISSNMTIEGNVVANSQNSNIINNGIIEGDFIVNDSSATGINNGTINGTAKLIDGTLINNGIIIDAYETNLQIANNGLIENSYIKELPITPNNYIVTFYMNGGKEITEGYTLFEKFTTASTILDLDSFAPIIEREGYTFDKWYMDEELTIEYDNSAIVSDINLYAKWNINKYDVTFDVDGVKTTTKEEYNSVITLPENPEKEGYTFEGWEGYTEGITVPVDGITFTAKWNINKYDVTFDVDGVKTTTKEEYNSVITLPENPEKEGYTFEGWEGYTVGITVPVDGITFTAKWNINKYDVIFDVDGVKTTTKEEYNSVITLPENPEKEGYTFEGWEGYTEGITVPVDGITFTAKWKKIILPPKTGVEGPTQNSIPLSKLLNSIIMLICLMIYRVINAYDN